MLVLLKEWSTLPREQFALHSNFSDIKYNFYILEYHCSTFSEDKPCEIVCTKRRKYAFYKPEMNVWMVMIVNSPYITKEKTKEIVYQETEVDNTLLNSLLVYIYQIFKVYKTHKNCRNGMF